MATTSLASRERAATPPALSWSSLCGEPVAVSLFAIGLSWPLAWLVLNSLSAVALHEESLGYRYFYTLRQLYEGATYLFLPQGQSTDLIFKLVHIALDLAGIPPTQLRPRIDYFYAGSMALFQTINVAAFAYLLRQAPPNSNSMLIAIFWLLPFYAPGTSAGYILLSPDYLAVEPAIAMLSGALMLNAYRSRDWSLENSLWLGIFLGAVVATKITLAVFPGVVVLFLILSMRPLKRSIANAAATGLASFAVWMLIVWADLSFGVGRLMHHFYDLQQFIRSGGGGIGPANEPWLSWLWTRAGQMPLISSFILLTPLLGIAALALARDRRQLMLLLSLLVGALAYTFALYRRDHNTTLIESGFYSFMLLWCTGYAIAQPWFGALWRSLQGPVRLAFRGLIAGVLVVLMVAWAQTYAAVNLPMFVKTWTAEQQFERLTEHVQGRRLWLVPDNDGRPMSVESAIMKGGSGLWGVWLEPDSALMRRTVPDLDFRFERRDQRPVKLEDYAAVLFMTRIDLKTRLHELNRRYNIDLFRLDCREVTAMATGMAVMCVPRKEAAQS